MMAANTTRVYFGRLPRDTREKDLQKLLKDYGDIKEINLKSGFGFVEFRDYLDAEDAIHDHNGKDFLGERIIVEFARGERRRRDDNRRDDNRRDDRRERDNGRYAPPQRTKYRIIVDNLSSSVSWQDLKDFMRKAGEVTFADVHKEREGEGVVEFSCYDDMKNAIRKLDDSELKGRRVYLREDSGSSSRGKRNRSHSRSPRRNARRRSRSRSLSPRKDRNGISKDGINEQRDSSIGGSGNGSRASRSPERGNLHQDNSRDRIRDRSRSRSPMDAD